MEAATRALGEIETRQRFRTRLTDRLSAVRQLESLCTLLMWVLARQLVEVHEVSSCGGPQPARPHQHGQGHRNARRCGDSLEDARTAPDVRGGSSIAQSGPCLGHEPPHAVENPPSHICRQPGTPCPLLPMIGKRRLDHTCRQTLPGFATS